MTNLRDHSEKRELKFRAWDKIVGCWSDDPNSSLAKITLGLDGSVIIEDDCATYRPEDYIIEQFTGLLDKNGKEIYEGDLLQRPDNTGRIGLVQFSHGFFGLNWDWKESRDPCFDGIILGGWGNRTNLRPMYDDLIYTLQIIGTIHDAEYKEASR